MTQSCDIETLAKLVGGTLRGDGKRVISGIAGVDEARIEQATWVTDPQYGAKLATSDAGAVLVPAEFGPTPMSAILCDNVERSVAALLSAFAPDLEPAEPGIHESAVVHETASIGADCSVGPQVVVEAGVSIGKSCVINAGCFLGQNTKLGEACVLWPGVVVRDGCVLGDRVVLHPNVVIGADGFGYFQQQGSHHKYPHIGGVVIEDDVEIGANSCVDRAKFGNTLIGAGTKIDNLVQVAHNVRIGKRCIVVSMTGVGGSTVLGNDCLVSGHVCIVDHVTIGDGARVLAGDSVVCSDIAPGSMVSGSPARDHVTGLRVRAATQRLPALIKQVKDLLARVERLETSTNHSP